MSHEKISTEQLRERFDDDVERFSDEQTGQRTIPDAALVLETVESVMTAMHPDATDLCDIGCGGGNFSLRIARKLPNLAVTLVDLSRPMLDRASQRLQAENFRVRATIQDDIRNIAFKPESFDIAVASASLHHLRTREQWHAVFASVFSSLRKGGSFWICDLIRHENPEVQDFQQQRYAGYLIELGGREYQKEIFEMIARADTPETIFFQARSLYDAGFRGIDIVHKNMLNFILVARKPRD